jgi:broad specificity phosphatase PhoE
MLLVQFFLARHGETQWNKVGRLQGQLDSPLTKQGIVQAKNIGKLLLNENISCIASSPLKRAIDSATICQHELKTTLVIEESLKERHFGCWQNTLISDIQDNAHFQEIFHQVSHQAPESGETGIECAIRFKQALTHLIELSAQSEHAIYADIKAETKKNILVLTHGEILRCFLSYFAKNRSNSNITADKLNYENGAILKVTFSEDTETFVLESQLSLIDVHECTTA